MHLTKQQILDSVPVGSPYRKKLKQLLLGYSDVSTVPNVIMLDIAHTLRQYNSSKVITSTNRRNTR